jgi:hypothetical protein
MQIPDSINSSRLNVDPATRLSATRSETNERKPEAPPVVQSPQPEPPTGDRLRSREVAEFARHIREMGDIRSEVVDAVKRLLAAGYYTSREAAEETAAAVIGESRSR